MVIQFIVTMRSANRYLIIICPVMLMLMLAGSIGICLARPSALLGGERTAMETAAVMVIVMVIVMVVISAIITMETMKIWKMVKF